MKLVFALLLIILGFQTAFAQNDTPHPGSDDAAFHSPFRYVIVAGVTKLDKYVNRFDDSLSMEVLVEDKAFNEKNLRELFGLLSKRFPSQNVLSAWVYTSIDAIKTPEENDHSDLKGPIKNYRQFKYAFFSRRPNKCDSFITYAYPGEEEETINLKCDKNNELIFD